MGSATQTRYGAAESSGRTDILSPLEQHSRASESFVFFVGVCQSAPHQSLAVRSRFLEGCLVVFPSSSLSIVHRRSRRPSSSSSIVVVVVHRRHRRPSSSSSHIIAITHCCRRILLFTLMSSLSSFSSCHPHLIIIPISSLFAMVSSPPTQPITIVSSPPTHPITIVYSLTVLVPTPTVVYSSPLSPDRTIVAVPSFFALRRRSWLIVIRHHLLTVFITTRVPTT